MNISVGHVKSKKRATSYLNIGYHEGYQLAMSLSANCVRTAPYSEDIRWRIVWQRLSKGLLFVEIAERLNVSISTVCRVYKLFKETNAVDPKSRCKPRLHTRQMDMQLELYVIGYVLEHPGIYLFELCRKIQDASGVQVSKSTICRLLRRHGFTRKKLQQIALQQSTLLRGKFMATTMLYKREQFVWLDETGSDNRTYLRKYGYAIKGERPRCRQLLCRGERISAIAALSTDGLVVAEVMKGTTNANTFF